MEEKIEQEFEEPSKSELKRRAEHLQQIGKQLTEFKKEILATLNLPEELREAIIEFHRIRSWGARRRQLQLIGKIMRTVDEETVTKAIDMATGNAKAATAALHKAEQLRDLLIAEDIALTSFIKDYPKVDVQELRSLIRNARREKATNKPPKAYRAIYKIIHAQLLPPLSLIEEEENEDD